MSEALNQELLSAYLDGEVTSAERAQVERWLAADPAARQLLDDLRALRATLQGLPRQRLDASLGPRVLQIAERRMLLGSDAGGDLSEPADSAPRSIWRDLHWRGMLSRRALFWSGLAVAIALVIRWNESPRRVRPPAEIQVAMTPREQGLGARGQGRGKEDLAERNKNAELRASGDREWGIAKEQLAAKNKDVARDETVDALRLKQTETADVATHNRARTAGPAADRSRRLAPSDAVADTPTAAAKEPASPMAAAAPKPPAAPAPRAAESHAFAMQPAPGPALADSREAAKAEADGQARRAAMKSDQQDRLARGAAPAEGTLAGKASLQGKVDTATVVRLDIRAEAAQNGSFERLLADVGISIGGVSARKQAIDGANVYPADKAQPTGELAATAMKRSLSSNGAAQRSESEAVQRPNFAYEVDATPAQLQTLLTQMIRQPQVYASVLVTGPPGQAGFATTGAPAADQKQRADSDSAFGLQPSSAGTAVAESPRSLSYGGAKGAAAKAPELQKELDNLAAAEKSPRDNVRKKSEQQSGNTLANAPATSLSVGGGTLSLGQALEAKPGAAPLCHVVFVLRVIDLPTAASVAAEKKADASKAAVPPAEAVPPAASAKPAAEPAKR